jgi:hypothetical protein
LNPTTSGVFKLEVPSLQVQSRRAVQPEQPGGTLTREERYIINNHIVQTILMLSTCPSPAIWATLPKLPAGITKKWTAPGIRNA